MDCDNVVFANDAPTFPNGAPIISYTQRNSGQQAIPTQVSVYSLVQKREREEIVAGGGETLRRLIFLLFNAQPFLLKNAFTPQFHMPSIYSHLVICK